MAFIQNTVVDLDGLLIQIDSISGGGATVTVNTVESHGLSTGDDIAIAGLATATDFNGNWTSITVTDADTFTFADTSVQSEGSIDGTSVGQMVRDNADGSYDTPEIHINAVAKRFSFKGSASDNTLYTQGTGVTGQALYSLFKWMWKNVSTITKFDFPMLSITNEQFEFIDGWRPDDGVSRQWTDLTFVTGTPDTITTAGTGDDDFTNWFKKGDRISITGSASNNFKDLRVASVTSTTITFADEVTEIVNEGTADVTATLASNIVHQSGETFETTTRKMIRTAGWSEVNAGFVSRRLAGIVTLGTLVDNTDQPYFVQNSSFTAPTENTKYTGPVNEAVPILIVAESSAANDYDFATATTITTTKIDFTEYFKVGDSIVIAGSTSNDGTEIVTAVAAGTLTLGGATLTVENGLSGTTLTADRTDTYKIFVRERGKTYEDADLNDIGVTTMTYIVYRFPVSNSTDLNIKTTDDGALAGVLISSLTGDGTTTTVNTSANHGLYAGAPVAITNTGEFTAGTYTVAGITDADTFTIENAFNGTETIGGTEAARLAYVANINLSYLPNPDTNADDVVIRGAYTQNPTPGYALGDVVFDTGNTKSNANGARWYYLDVAGTGAGNGADMNADEGDGTSWVLWSDGIGQQDIEETDTWSAYTAVMDLNDAGATPGATKEVAYEWAQYLLRQTTDINDNANSTDRNGEVADTLVYFVGSQLHTYADSSIPFAVGLLDIAAADVNNVTYHDYADATHLAPIVVLVSINFNNNLFGDSDAIFYAYYTTGEGAQSGNDFGTAGAIQVKESNTNNVGETVAGDMSGVHDVPSGGEYTFNYAYDADTTNGRTGGTDVNITIMAIGLGTGQYVQATGNITSAGGSFSLVAPLERNYSNPA